MDVMAYCPEKVFTPENAVRHIKNGSRVFIGTGCGEPQQLIKAMGDDQRVQDIVGDHMLSS